MALVIENATEVKKEEAAQAIYVAKEAHDNVDKILAILEGAGKQITGVKNTKRAMFEYATTVLLEMVESSPLFKKAEEPADK